MRPFVRVLIAGLVALVVWTLTKEDNLRQRISGTPVSKEAPVVVGHEVWHTKSSRGICQLLPPHWQHASALALWTENIGKIHNASQLLPMDAQYEFSDLNAILLHLISPRLPNSVKALPRDWKDIKHVLEEVVYPRWRYIMHAEKQGDKIPRPAKIVIMGGSVVAGVNCLQVFSNKVKHQLTREQCAWPHRLQQFLDSIVGGQEKRIFEVHTFAMGGGNTITGNTLLEFDLLPSEAKHPDIVINAYSTNDMHIITLNEAESTSSFRIEGSWREKVMAATQDFIRTVSSPLRDCNSQSANVPTTPVIFHVDDYLGNMQREILATTELSQAVQVLANYYGNVVAMSYPDLVRDFVYGDTHEAWFSPLGWYPTYKQGTNQMAREIHPGMPMHTTIPWIVSYNMLNLLLTYCDKYPYHHENVRSSSGNPEEDNPRAKIFDDEYDVARTKGNLPLPELKKVVPLPGKPRITPNGLPPPLSPDLSLQDFTDLWKSQADSTNINNRAHTVQCTSPEHPKCPFSWVSGLLSEHNSLDEQGVVDYFKANSLGYFNHGWELKRNVDGRKMGWLPVGEQPGANMTMIFGNADSSPIRQVVLLYLKSYGERWDNSILQVRIDRLSTFEPIMYRQLVGYHAKNTSEMYVERMPLPEPRAGEDPRVRLQAFFMNGRAFKIMGLLICR